MPTLTTHTTTTTTTTTMVCHVPCDWSCLGSGSLILPRHSMELPYMPIRPGVHRQSYGSPICRVYRVTGHAGCCDPRSRCSSWSPGSPSSPRAWRGTCRRPARRVSGATGQHEMTRGVRGKETKTTVSCELIMIFLRHCYE